MSPLAPLKPIRLGLSPHYSTKTTLGKVINDLHLDKLNGHLIQWLISGSDILFYLLQDFEICSYTLKTPLSHGVSVLLSLFSIISDYV